MNEKDAQVLIDHLMKMIEETEKEYETMVAGRYEVPAWNLADLAQLRGQVIGLKKAIDLIESAVDE